LIEYCILIIRYLMQNIQSEVCFTSFVMILFTRSLDDASRARLHAAHINFAEIDFIKQTPSVDAAVLNIITTSLTEHIVFTSQNAIKIFFQIIDNQGFKLNKNTKFYSLSGTTKMLLEQYAYPPQLTADTGSALAKVMLETGIKDGVTFICGNLRMPYLPDFLSKNGVKVQELIIYKTELVPLSISDFGFTILDLRFDKSIVNPKSKIQNALVFFSPSGVDAFLIKNKIPEETVIFAMGKTTAGHITEKTSINTVLFPENPTLSGLIDLVVNNQNRTK
jgi:uroporphyrinogen-III synthase